MWNRLLVVSYNNLFTRPREFFARKLSEMNKQSVVFSNFLQTPAKAQLASFKVAYRIAKCKKLHTTSTRNKDAYLICYVRFIDNDDNIVEDLLFCKPILKNCRAHELFAVLNNFFQENNLKWKYCVGLCTDGARVISDRFGGLRTLVQGVAVNARCTHCLI